MTVSGAHISTAAGHALSCHRRYCNHALSARSSAPLASSSLRTELAPKRLYVTTSNNNNNNNNNNQTRRSDRREALREERETSEKRLDAEKRNLAELEKEYQLVEEDAQSLASSQARREWQRLRNEPHAASTNSGSHEAKHSSASPPTSIHSSHSGGSGGGGEEEEEAAPEHPEPTLEDLDRSIPQVDCEFIANLIRTRTIRRQYFLREKKALKERVEKLTQERSKSVDEAVSLPRVGGLWRRAQSMLVDEDSLVATTPVEPVLAAPEVLAALSDKELDVLHSARPEYDDGFILIDCRTVNEVTSWGMIEGAKVLPAHELFEAFHATPEDFKELYGFPKPKPDEVIVLYCQYGPRSLMAAQILSWMGYLKVLHFRDGYYEWGKQYNLLLRRWMKHDEESGNDLRRLANFQAALELQREIAPEFNALPMQEAAMYEIDTTRSRGTLLIGEGLRAEAYAAVARLLEEAPPALPALEAGQTPSNPYLAEDHEAAAAAAVADAKRINGGAAPPGDDEALLGRDPLSQFLEQATGLNPQTAVVADTTINYRDAQDHAIGSAYKGKMTGLSGYGVGNSMGGK